MLSQLFTAELLTPLLDKKTTETSDKRYDEIPFIEIAPRKQNY